MFKTPVTYDPYIAFKTNDNTKIFVTYYDLKGEPWLASKTSLLEVENNYVSVEFRYANLAQNPIGIRCAIDNHEVSEHTFKNVQRLLHIDFTTNEGTATTTVTTITEVVSAPTETDSLTETPEEDDFSDEDAVNLMLEAVRSMADEDFDKMLQITNFGDVCRIAEDNSGNLTDEEILKEIKENKDSFDMTEWRENAETMRNMTVNDIDEPVRMSQEDIKDITSILESMSHGKRTIPEYVDGYKASFFNSGDIAHMYVFKGTDGVWRYDICFGMMRDGFAQLGVQNFSD